MSKDSNLQSVPVDTDDLDAFTKLLTGEATPEEAKSEDTDEKLNENIEDNSLAPEDDASDGSETDENNESDTEENDDDSLVDDDSEDNTLLKIKPKKKSAKERIDELTANWRSTERALQEALREVEKLRTPSEQTEPKTVRKETSYDEDLPRPDAVDEHGNPLYPLGDYDPQFIIDLNKVVARKEIERARAEENAAREKAAEEEAKLALTTEWASKLEEAEKSMPDLRTKGMALEAAFSNLDPGYGEYLVSAIMSLDNGPEVLYYLSDNLSEARSIVEAGPARATMALGRLDAILSKPKAESKKIKTPTNAPPPPAVRARGSNGRFTDSDDLDDLDVLAEKLFRR